MQTRKIQNHRNTLPTRLAGPPTHTFTLCSTYHQQRKAHIHSHAAELCTKNLVQNTHCRTHHTGTHRYISDHSKRYHHRIRHQITCYQQAFYVDNLAQKYTKTQPLYTHHFINSKASWNKDSLKPP